MLNILHFHINDMSDEVSIDQRWLKEDERDKLMQGDQDKVSFPEFKKDANWMLLRYLILIYDQKVFDILYNPGEQADPESIRYHEHRVDIDRMQIMRPQSNDNAAFQFGKITQIPYQMMSSQNKQHLDNIVEATCVN